jgi:hypothetical protein
MKRIVTILWLLLFLVTPCFAEPWTFVAIGDHRAAFSSYRNVLEETRTMTVNADPKFSAVDLVVACGDIDPVDKNWEIFQEVFHHNSTSYIPVRGNHENPTDVGLILDKILPSYGGRVKLHNKNSVSYYMDWKNVRLIVLDQYSDFGKALNNKPALKWLEDTINSATKVQHIFIAFHEPYLPANPKHDGFWSILFRHTDKVRAVFSAHSHVYGRLQFRDVTGNIYYINTGNAGQNVHGDNQQTLVEVSIDDNKVSFRALQAPDGTNQFRVTDQW